MYKANNIDTDKFLEALKVKEKFLEQIFSYNPIVLDYMYPCQYM